MRVHVRQDLIDNPKEILAWHIFLLTGDTAVAPAMTAGDIAPERTLPKERVQLVCLAFVPLDQPEKLQGDPLAESRVFGERFCSHAFILSFLIEYPFRESPCP